MTAMDDLRRLRQIYLDTVAKRQMNLLILLLLSTASFLANGAGMGTLEPCGDAFYYVGKVRWRMKRKSSHSWSLLMGMSVYVLQQQFSLSDLAFGTYFQVRKCLLPAFNVLVGICSEHAHFPTAEEARCADEQLVYPPFSASSSSPTASSTAISPTATGLAVCLEDPTMLYLSSPPYENYFYSDCHTAAQVVVTSPESSSDLTLIGPRLLIAWPAGNSGVVAFFSPQSGINGSLAVSLLNPSTTTALFSSVYAAAPSTSSSDPATFGISGLFDFNTSATLTVPILGSIRTIRDFTEGPSLLRPKIQDAIVYDKGPGDLSTVTMSRLWLDNVTTTRFSFTAVSAGSAVTLQDDHLSFEAGTYRFNASFNYPQLTQLNALSVLALSSVDLIMEQPVQTASLAFLSYSQKLLAGGWRFLTYFGRDSMISALLMQSVLSQGKGGAVEAVISAVLERLNGTSGQVCHEETIGDYATWLHLQDNVTSTASICAYTMVDTDLYLPVLVEDYFLKTEVGRSRATEFMEQEATLPFGNEGAAYQNLLLRNAEWIMNLAAPFVAEGGQIEANLRHLEDDQIVGQWRDSTYGIGGGRIPFDVNTALIPAALRAISSLSAAGFFPTHSPWTALASQYAQVWEDSTLSFFTLAVDAADARALITSYAQESNFAGPSYAENITSTSTFYALALEGNNQQSKVRVMHSDTAFRLYLLNTTDDAQLTTFLNATANSILLPYPAGLMTEVGLLVANPAYGGAPVYAANWTTADYHGTVVWGWPMAMMAAGLQRQLERCLSVSASGTAIPAFCRSEVYGNVRAAYNRLWDVIEANVPQLSEEVWSWKYTGEGFEVLQLSELSPTGMLCAEIDVVSGMSVANGCIESDIVQLWSLAYLAVRRDETLR